MYLKIPLFHSSKEMVSVPDIWASAVRVFDAAVEKAYNGDRKIHWKEVFAGEKSQCKKCRATGYLKKLPIQ